MNAADLSLADFARRRPPAPWEAYFLIGVFPASSPIRWCKIQLFSGGATPGRHCVAALEGMDGPGRALILLGREDRVDATVRDLSPDDLVVASDRWSVSIPGLSWTGRFPDLTLRCEAPALTAKTHTRDVYWWMRAPGLVSYFSSFGEVSLAVDGVAAEGLSIVEHAWGAETRADVFALSPQRWHWDVLWPGDASWFASLSIDTGLGLAGMCGGRIGESPVRRGVCGVRWREWSTEGDVPRPTRWTGQMRTREGVLRYEAKAATPAYEALRDGGYMSTTWEGRWEPRKGRARDLGGAGFCEYRRTPRLTY